MSSEDQNAIDIAKWLELLEVRRTGGQGMVGNFLRVPTVYKAVRLRSDAVARGRPKVYKPTRSGREEWVGNDDPVQNLLDHVNDGATRVDMWGMVEMYLGIYGESYRWINKAGRPNNPSYWEIISLHPSEMKPQDDGVTITGFVMPENNNTFSTDEVLYDRYLHPLSKFRGLSPLVPAAESANLHREMMRHNREFFEQGMALSNLAFFLNEFADETDVDALYERLGDRHAGSKNAHRPMVVTGGSGTVQNLGASNRDMEFIAGMNLVKYLVIDVYGIPDELMAGSDTSTYSNRAVALRDFYSNTITTEWTMLESRLQENFIPILPRAYRDCIIKFDREEIEELQETRQEKTTRHVEVVGGGIYTANEVREEDGVGPHPEGSHLHNPIGRGDEGEADDDTEREETAGGDEVEGDGSGETPERRALSDLNQMEQRLLNQYKATENRQIKEYSERFQASFVELGRVVENAYLEVIGLRQQDLEPDEQLVDRILGQARLDMWEQLSLGATFGSLYESTLRLTIGDINAGIGLTMGVPDGIVQRVINEGGTRRELLNIQGQARTTLFRAIAEGRAAGEGAVDLARRIRDQVPAGPYVRAGAKYRALLIARTETRFAQNISQLEGYRESRVVRGVKLVDNQLGFNDEVCLLRDGQEVTFAEAEAAMLGEHPNGTLGTLPILYP